MKKLHLHLPLLVIALGLMLSASVVFAAQKYQLPRASTAIVNEFGTCRSVSNANAGIDTVSQVLIPTQSSPEWSSFVAHPPSGITVNACIYGCTDSSARNYDSSANVDDGTCDYSPVCDTQVHYCSAKFTGYDYSENQTQDTVYSLYQSCSISESDYAALNTNGQETHVSQTSNGCPQCWTDTWSYQGTTWECSRSAWAPDYPYFQSGMDGITYYTSCTISDSEKQSLIDQGYYDDGLYRAYGPNDGEWTDTHYMTRCE